MAEFGVAWTTPGLLDGGQRRAWRVGDVVLKPVDDVVEHSWVCDVLAGLPVSDAIRTPQPLRTACGGWSSAGWSAHRYLAGEPLSMATDATLIRSAAEAFHLVVKDVAQPAFLSGRSDRWAFGDRVAWDGAVPVGSVETLDLLRRALAAYEPVASPSQLVHGDLAGNVLGAPGLAPAVIDWPPYWHPTGWALAVAAADGVCWYGAPATLLEDWSDIAEWGQLLLRALVYRVATVGWTECDGHPAMDPLSHSKIVSPLLERVLQLL